jgi:hypothetical protein
MVRTYIRKATARQRKGGHGGDRSKAGLPAGDWQEKGGRALAPHSSRRKGCSKSKRIAVEVRHRAKRRRCARSIFKKCSTFYPFLKMLRGGLLPPARTVNACVEGGFGTNLIQTCYLQVFIKFCTVPAPPVSFYRYSYDTDEKWLWF